MTTQSKTSGQKTLARICVIAVVMLLFGGLNLILIRLFETGPETPLLAWLMGSCLGMVIGQINLISIWAAMSPGRVVQRLPWSMLLTVMMWYTLVIIAPDIPADGIVDLGVILVVAQIIAQIPLWIGSQVFGFRLATDSLLADRRQFSLRDLLLGTGLLAVTLALCRVVFPADWAQVRFDRMSLFQPMFLALLTTLVVANQLTVVPCIWLSSRPLGQFAWLIPLLLGFIGLVSIAQFAAWDAIIGSLENDIVEAYTFIFSVNSGQCLAVILTLLILRCIGLRMRRIRPGQIIRSGEKPEDYVLRQMD